MGYKFNFAEADNLFSSIFDKYDVYAPKRFPKQGRYSDTDIIRYDKVKTINEIEFNQKSDYSAKEVLAPINETLFYFTENEFKESSAPQKTILLFARPCDINALEVQSKIYEENGEFQDIYFSRIKNNLKFVLMDCKGGDDTCFCVSMNSNSTDNWSIAIKQLEGEYLLSVKDAEFEQYFQSCQQMDFSPEFVQQNELSVEIKDIPNKEVLNELKQHSFWLEYDKRCIACGACARACEKGATRVLSLNENLGRIEKDECCCVGCGECVRACPTSAWTRQETPFYRVIIGGRTGRQTPRAGKMFLNWATEDVILNTLKNWQKFSAYVMDNKPEYLHGGHLIDRAGYKKFKEIMLDGVKLNPECLVAENVFWQETEYRSNFNVKPLNLHK